METHLAPPKGPSGWTRRRAAIFALSMSPFIALLVLLAWGQLTSGNVPGLRLEHDQTSEQDVAQRTAPGFGGTDVLTGAAIDNASVNGKIVLLDFWSSWCTACTIEAADLASVYQEYASQPVEFVGVAIWDEPGDILRHVDRYGVTYPNVIDNEGATAVSFGVRGVPEKFFLDENGTIIRKVIGPVSPEQLREILDSLLAA